MYYDSRIFHYLCTRIKESLSMDVMKVISVRMTEKELADIDEALKPHRYYKRSDLIRAAVKVLLTANLDPDNKFNLGPHRTAVYNALRMPYGYHTGMNVKLEIEHYDERTKGNQK